MHACSNTTIQTQARGSSDCGVSAIRRPATGIMSTSWRCPRPIASDFSVSTRSFQSQLRSVRKAMADYFAGQRFFDFYTEAADDDEAEQRETVPARGSLAGGGDSIPTGASEVLSQPYEESPRDDDDS